MTDFSWLGALQKVTCAVKVVVSKKWREIDTLLLHTTNRKYHMAYLFVPFPITVDDLEGHSPNPRIGMPNNISVVKGATKIKLSRRRGGFSVVRKCCRAAVQRVVVEQYPYALLHKAEL